MPVFGEETLEVPIFNGLGSTDCATTDLCGTLINLVQTGPSEYSIREDLIELQELNKAAVNVATTAAIPRNYRANTFEVFTAVGSQTVNSPTLLTFFDNLAGTQECNWLNCNATTPVTTNQALPATYGVRAFCQFRDRYYAASLTKIFKLTNFNTGGGVMTVTDLSTVSVDILLTFRSRMFGIKKGRIYYTDLPTIGGYPETWNLNLNFVDIPSVDYDITVFNAQVYRDKIYLFTDKGIYVFNVSGDPTNWSIQLVSSSFPIFDRDSVCINKNMIFLTDQSSVVMFDGVTFSKISENIRGVFHEDIFTFSAGTLWFSVYPYEDGIVLIRQLWFTGSGNYSPSGSGNNLIYYYNMAIWTEVKMTDQQSVVRAGTNFLPYRGKAPSSWIYFECNTPANTVRMMLLDAATWKGDVQSTNHTGGTRLAKIAQLDVPRVFARNRRYIKHKYVMLYGMINVLTPGNITLNSIAMLAGDNFGNVWKVPAFQNQQSQFSSAGNIVFRLLGTVDADVSTSFGIPQLVICGVELIYDQDNRNLDTSTGMKVG